MKTPIEFDAEAFAEYKLDENEQRPCRVCGELKPESDYSSPKAATCRKCRNINGRARQIKRLKGALAELATRQFIAASKGDRLDAPRVSQVCAEIFDRLGGVGKFCDMWRDNLLVAMDEQPGSRMVLDQFRHLARLAAISTASVDGQTFSVDGLSDDELDNLIQQEAQRALTHAGDDLQVEDDDIDY